MKFTPLDIRQKRFATAFRGLARRDVQAFLELLSAEFEEVVKENIALKEELKRVQGQLEHHLERERTLQQTMVTAQRVSDDLKGVAKKEADVIVSHTKLLEAFQSPTFSADEPRMEDNISFLAPKKAGGTES